MRTPRRTCVGCREVGPKRALIRLIRGADGRAVVDIDGRGVGRGAYACPRLPCLEQALTAGRLARSLRRPCEPPRESAAAILESWRRR